MSPTKLNTNLSAHLLLGGFVGLWVVVFLVAVAPFDTSDLSLRLRLLLLPPYGVIFFLAYGLAVWGQNRLFARLGRWHWTYEVAVIGLTYLVGLAGSFVYYQSEVLRGTYTFWEFLAEIYLPTVLIVSFLLLGGRWQLNRQVTKTPPPLAEITTLTLTGEGRTDVLQIASDQLVAASGAQNYVEVSFVQGAELKKQLLRTTLRDIEQQVPMLVRVHRSHLVNPSHFIRWEGPDQVLVHSLQLPVSRSYRKRLDAAVR